MSAVLETMSTISDSKKIHETLEAKGFTAEQADGIYEVVSQYIPPQIHAVTYAEQRHNDDNFDRINQQIELMRDILIRMDKRMDRFEDRFEKIDARFEKIDARFEKIDARFEKFDERFEKINATLMSSRYLLVGSLCSSIIAAAGIIAVALLR